MPLEVTLGLLDEAVANGRPAVEDADRSGDAFQKMANRTTAANALHQRGDSRLSLRESAPFRGAKGDIPEARALLEEAERMQAERQPQFPLLYSLGGFRYADPILAPAERAVWQCRLSLRESTRPFAERKATLADALAACTEAARRATEAHKIAMEYDLGLLTIALDHLTLGRATLYRAILESGGVMPPSAFTQPPFSTAASHLQQALDGLRQANDVEFVAKALLTASLLESLQGEKGRLKAEHYLSEAQQIAERGPMPLYLADVALYRARLRIFQWQNSDCGLRNEEFTESEIRFLKSELAAARCPDSVLN